MTSRKAPEIFQKPIKDIDFSGLPARGSAEFAQALITRYALDYAQKGWNALVTVDDEFVRVLAIPENSIEPKTYVLGLLKDRYLEDALPLLEAMSGMIQDADVEYNLGICLSEMGKTSECIAPLEKCVSIDSGYVNAYVGLGVAYTRLGNHDLAEHALREAVKLEPENAFAKRTLAAALARAGKPNDALPYFRQAASLTPSDPVALLGLAQCLESLGGDHMTEAGSIFEQILKRYPDHPLSDIARKARNRISNENLHDAVDGGIRMDVVMYMQGAFDAFAKMPKEQVGKAIMEIAILGQNGLKINDPMVRYSLENMPGDFSGLQLLSMMHVGLKQFDPTADSGSGLNREYEVAAKAKGIL